MSPKEFELLCVKPEMCLRDALLRMDLAARGVLLMIKKDGSLARTVTDGDLRRAILKGFGDSSLLGALPIACPIAVSDAADDPGSFLGWNRFQERFKMDRVCNGDAGGVLGRRNLFRERLALL